MIEAKQVTPLVQSPLTSRNTHFNKVNHRQLCDFTQQLATLIGAGVPLLQSLETVHRSMQSQPLAPVIHQLHQSVSRGLSFQAALQSTGVFDQVYCQMVAAGELAGTLDDMLNRLAIQADKQQQLIRKLKGALIYPLAVLLIAAAVVAVILVWVVPVFQSIFDSFGAQLPLPTRMILNLSSALMHWGLPVSAVLLILTYGLKQQYQRRTQWQWRLAIWSLRLPVVAGLIRSANLAMWTRCLAMLCQSGIALLDALEVLAGVCNNRVYAMSCLEIRASVLRGTSLATSMDTLSNADMEQQRLFPSLLIQMIDIGEQSGTLIHLLAKAADAQEALFEQQVMGLTQLIEPLLVVVLGGVVGGLVIALYLPVFQLGQVI